jgi:hypothetical protein
VWLAPLVLDGSPEVDLAFLTLAHEPLQLLLELGIRTASQRAWCGVLKGFDREVDLPIFLDGHDLGLHLVVLAKVFSDIADIVPVDLGDVDEADPTVFELEEGSVRGDSLDGPLHDRTDFYVCD